jgi:hypothetical protein
MINFFKVKGVETLDENKIVLESKNEIKVEKELEDDKDDWGSF